MSVQCSVSLGCPSVDSAAAFQEKQAASEAQLSAFEADLSELDRWLQEADRAAGDDGQVQVSRPLLSV